MSFDHTHKETPQKRPQSLSHIFLETEARRKERTTPYLGEVMGTIYVAISVIIMAFSGLIKLVPIVVFLLLWLTIPMLKGLSVIKPARDMVWMLPLPLLCLVSTLWSDYPSKTLYQGAAFTGMMLCVILMNRVIDFRSFIKGISLGLVFLMLITIASNIYDTDFMTGTYALVGYFGSKNTVGFMAQIAIIVSVLTFSLHRSLFQRLVFCVLPLVIAGYCLLASKSASSLISCIFSLGVVGTIYLIAQLPKNIRLLSFATVIALSIASIGVGFSLGLDETILKSVGKDTTLTGRTYLWAEGIKIGLQKPLFGHGYTAFWVQGQPMAERYWHEFFIAARAGFHFHSAHIQTFVDLGMVGLIGVVALYLMTMITSVRGMFHSTARMQAALWLCLSCVFFIRSFVEVDILGPFGFGVFIFFSIVARLTSKKLAIPTSLEINVITPAPSARRMQ